MDLVLDHLSKSYGEHVVIKDLTHTFQDCRITCIVGPSGCGKTTLLHLIAGLIPPDSGRILGRPSGAIPTVIQEDRLIEHLSAAANISVVYPKRRREIKDALTAIGLDPDQPIGEMSGGMRRRVALVRALLPDGSLILMDEPFKGLDADTRKLCIAFAKSYLEGKTALIVTHDPVEAGMLKGDIWPFPIPSEQ